MFPDDVCDMYTELCGDPIDGRRAKSADEIVPMTLNVLKAACDAADDLGGRLGMLCGALERAAKSDATRVGIDQVTREVLASLSEAMNMTPGLVIKMALKLLVLERDRASPSAAAEPRVLALGAAPNDSP